MLEIFRMSPVFVVPAFSQPNAACVKQQGRHGLVKIDAVADRDTGSVGMILVSGL
jgi:hypothetical protein